MMEVKLCLIGYFAVGAALVGGGAVEVVVAKVEVKAAGAGEAVAPVPALGLAATAFALSAGTSSHTRWVSVAWI